MKLPFKHLFLFTLFLILTCGSIGSTSEAQAQSRQLSDQIVAVVNDRIILKSDVDNQIRDYMRQAQMEGQSIPFSENLWYSVLQSMVDNYAMLEKAEIDSIVVSNDLVDRQMDQRIRQLVQQAGSEQALEDAFGKSIVELRAEFREQFREQMIVQQVQRSIAPASITRPEVEEFFNSIPQDSIPIIPEQVELSQIVIIPEPLEHAREEAYQLARTLRDSVTTYEKSFEEMARRYSQDGSATRGGLLPMTPMSDLVSSYSAAATALQSGEISEVVETPFGFHIIRLNQRDGDNIETNHILIKIDDEQVDEQAAIDRLNAMRDSVLSHGANFADLARRHSQDEFTRASGGRIVNPQTGERVMTLNQLDPALYRAVLLLEEAGEISEPRPYNPQRRTVTRAYRIIRLDRHIPEHRANLSDDYDQIEATALQQKQMNALSKWIDGLRDEIFIEFKIPVPELDPDPEMLLAPEVVQTTEPETLD